MRSLTTGLLKVIAHNFSYRETSQLLFETGHFIHAAAWRLPDEAAPGSPPPPAAL